jgi:hypothetical protein
MKLTIILIVISFGGGMIPAARAEVSPLAHELTKLKQEVRELKIALHRLQITTLERQLEQARANRTRIDAQRSLVEQGVLELDEQLTQPLDSESYSRLMETRRNMVNERVNVLNSEQQRASAIEAQVMKLIEGERQRLQGTLAVSGQ